MVREHGRARPVVTVRGVVLPVLLARQEVEGIDLTGSLAPSGRGGGVDRAVMDGQGREQGLRLVVRGGQRIGHPERGERISGDTLEPAALELYDHDAVSVGRPARGVDRGGEGVCGGISTCCARTVLARHRLQDLTGGAVQHDQLVIGEGGGEARIGLTGCREQEDRITHDDGIGERDEPEPTFRCPAGQGAVGPYDLRVGGRGGRLDRCSVSATCEVRPLRRQRGMLS